MQIKDLNKIITSKQLNENLTKRFGYSIKLDEFSDAKLDDVRNKLTTRISQFELNEGYDDMLNNPEYQKTKMFLDVINQEISERALFARDRKLTYSNDSSDLKRTLQKRHGRKQGRKIYMAKMRKRAMEESVPESWINNAIKRIKLGESDFDELKSELIVRYDLSESKANWILLEDVEVERRRAEVILATKDIIDRITNWLDDMANTKGEQLLELEDAIKADYDSNVAQKYSQIVKPALNTIYDAIENSRAQLNNALSLVSGEQTDTMGMDNSAQMPTDDLSSVENPMPELPTDQAPVTDTSAVGGEVPPIDASREKRESIDYSRKLALMLSSKKK